MSSESGATTAAGHFCCFQRKIPKNADSLPGGVRSAALRASWPVGQEITITFLRGGTPQQREAVERFSKGWLEYANVQFKYVNDPNALIRIEIKDNFGGGRSYLGTENLTYPKPWEPTMVLGAMPVTGEIREDLVLHEFGHMLGLIHEHQNPKDNPIVWNKERVKHDMRAMGNDWTDEEFEAQVFSLEYNITHQTTFDTYSIMLYPVLPGWSLNGYVAPVNTRISEADQALIRFVYPRRGEESLRGTTVLPVLVLEGTEADIGSPGEEDNFAFTVRKSAQYTIETSGETDVVMTLLSSDGVLLFRDDNSGENRNPKIKAMLVPADYKVHIRHIDPQGTGKYRIRVLQE